MPMTQAEKIFNETESVFQTVFEKTDLKILNNTTANDINGWDSLTHMYLISEIEKKFEIKFTFKEILSFATVGDMISCISNKVASKA